VIEFPSVPNPAREDAPPAGTGTGHLASPRLSNGAGVLVLHAWWGLNDAFRAIANELAEEGYTALAPDAYGDGQPATTVEQAEARADAIDLARAEQTLLGAFDHLAEQVQGPIGTVGFSMGSGFGLWLARKRQERLAATVLYYGAGGAAGGTSPVLGHYAAVDEWQPAQEIEELEEELREAGRLVAFHRYDGVSHWFSERDRPEYDVAAAGLAWRRTLDFLHDRLGG
jgi:carboxymethylenebutenolidase